MACDWDFLRGPWEKAEGSGAQALRHGRLPKANSSPAEPRPGATGSDHLGPWEEKEGLCGCPAAGLCRQVWLPGGRFLVWKSSGYRALCIWKPLIKTSLGHAS